MKKLFIITLLSVFISPSLHSQLIAIEGYPTIEQWISAEQYAWKPKFCYSYVGEDEPSENIKLAYTIKGDSIVGGKTYSTVCFIYSKIQGQKSGVFEIKPYKEYVFADTLFKHIVLTLCMINLALFHIFHRHTGSYRYGD